MDWPYQHRKNFSQRKKIWLSSSPSKMISQLTFFLLESWCKVLEDKYLLWRSSYQAPFLFCNLNRHLVSNHMFFISKFPTPNTPWSFGLHKTSHLLGLYIYLCLCQNNFDSIQVLLMTLWVFKNENTTFMSGFFTHFYLCLNRIFSGISEITTLIFLLFL